MGFDFGSIVEQKKSYLRSAGLQQGATLVGLSYIANENWEGYDIELTTHDGKTFTERTFSPVLEKVYPKAIWGADGKQVGTETQPQALGRVQGEVATKLYYLALCFAEGDTIKSKVKSCEGMKEMVDKINSVIKSNSAWQSIKLNFLTIWKNSDKNSRSNLIIAEKVRWVEPTIFGVDGTTILPATISLTNWQETNAMTEKYPYNGNQVPAVATSVLNDMPF